MADPAHLASLFSHPSSSPLPPFLRLDLRPPQFSSVQFGRSVVSNSLRPHGLQHARTASLPLIISQGFPKFTSLKSVMPSNHLILCRPLLLLSPVLPSIRVFFNESAVRIRWPKSWRQKCNLPQFKSI